MGVWAFVFPGHKLWLPFGAFPPSISPHFKLSLSYPWAAKLGATHHSVKEQKQFLNVAPGKYADFFQDCWRNCSLWKGIVCHISSGMFVFLTRSLPWRNKAKPWTRRKQCLLLEEPHLKVQGWIAPSGGGSREHPVLHCIHRIASGMQQAKQSQFLSLDSQYKTKAAKFLLHA